MAWWLYRFSATFERAVRDIAQEFYRDAVTVHIGLDVLNACSNIEQRVEITNNYTHKLERYKSLISPAVLVSKLTVGGKVPLGQTRRDPR